MESDMAERIPFTQKMLVAWAGPDVVRDAGSLVDRGLVLCAAFEPPEITGAILWNNRELKTSLTLLPDGNVESHCPCYANTERGLICAHVIALAMTLIQRAADPERERKHADEERRARRLATIDASRYLTRVPLDAAGAVPATLALTLAPDWRAHIHADGALVDVHLVHARNRLPLDQAPTDVPFAFSQAHEALLYVLEDISEGPVANPVLLRRRDLVNVLALSKGDVIEQADGEPLTVAATPLTSLITLDLDRETGDLLLTAHTETPFREPGLQPLHIVDGREGWVYAAGHFWPLDTVLPPPYHRLYHETVAVGRADVIRFLKRELPDLARCARIVTDLSLDLFTIDRAEPVFRLAVRGSPASLSATLFARYDGIEFVCSKPDPREHFAIPDPDDLMRYMVRHPCREKEALGILARTGLCGEVGDALDAIVGKRAVLNFLGRDLPALRRRGWRVELAGRIAPFLETMEFTTPVVRIDDDASGGWFDVRFEFDTGNGASLSPADIHTAIRRGEAFVSSGTRTVLIDSSAVNDMQDIFADCDAGEGGSRGAFRLASLYAPYVKSSLDVLDGIDIEDTPAWRDRAARGNRALAMPDATLPPDLEGTLRAYQKTGVAWLRFLEANGFAGILADEMGLGKTIQTLAWLQMPRLDASIRGRPALIVCPTSLVDNWAEECARFVPGLKVLTLVGQDRHTQWDALDKADIAVTSYALLRRDGAIYQERTFSVVVLDEAQHIKNRATQNARSVKGLRAAHRLVLTGTPVENGVADLWSIMDFLMPGYLGPYDQFRARYELPIARATPDSDPVQARLRRKLNPFLLRRLKSEVARDLPPKIERVAACRLTSDQAAVYRALAHSAQERLGKLVAERGFDRCRMDVLTTLMRLRQACCHLELLQMEGLQAAEPSSKLDAFMELVDEAIDGNHRILVFSQFTSMLAILRRELDAREIRYCYLDGATRDRMRVVHAFNTDRGVPLFLISLKAGGTGLNLTGADMVIHFDPWWNPAVEDQATDRAYRIGQKRTVYSIKLVTRGTVEEKVIALQERKRRIIDATLQSDDVAIRALSWDDVQDLLRL
jgi:superfamily II DNA or RNA helicase